MKKKIDKRTLRQTTKEKIAVTIDKGLKAEIQKQTEKISEFVNDAIKLKLRSK